MQVRLEHDSERASQRLEQLINIFDRLWSLLVVEDVICKRSDFAVVATIANPVVCQKKRIYVGGYPSGCEEWSWQDSPKWRIASETHCHFQKPASSCETLRNHS